MTESVNVSTFLILSSVRSYFCDLEMVNIAVVLWFILSAIPLFLPDPSITDPIHTDTHSVYERISLQKLPFVHRAVNVTSDSNGCNFAVLQSDPKTR